MFEGWGAGIAAGAIVGSVGGALIEGSAAQSAAQTQANAANNAQQISQQEFNTITQQEQPFIQGGYGALSALNYGLGIGPQTSQSATSIPSGGLFPNGTGGYSYLGPYPGTGVSPGSSAAGLPPSGYDPLSGYQIGAGGSLSQLLPGGGAPAGAASGAASTATPGQGTGLGYGSLLAPFTASTFQQYSPAYNFQLQQGKQGVLNADSANQGALSGAALKDLISFNQNYANTAFNNAFNQYQTQQGNIYSRLSGIAQLGQAAATNTGQQGTALAGQAAQSATNIGTALAGGTVGAANAAAGGLSSLSALPWLYGSSGSAAFSGGGGFGPGGGDSVYATG